MGDPCESLPSRNLHNRLMITDRDIQVIRETAAKYQAKRVVLFGSSLLHESEYRDIDIGVEGVPENEFFSFYGDLMCALSKPVDVIDLSEKNRFSELVNLEGIALYG